MGDVESAPTPEELLTRGVWPYELGPYEAFGQRYCVLTDDEDLAAFLEDLYAPLAVERAGGDALSTDDDELAVVRLARPSGSRGGTVLSDRVLLGSSVEPSRLLELLQWAINRKVIDHAAARRLVLHAGAVDRDGAAVLLAGHMEAGKTTLTTGLLERGFRYLTDEAVAVAPDLTIEGYAKPLSIDPGSWEVLAHLKPELRGDAAVYLERQWLVPAHRLTAVVGSSTLAAVIVTRYVDGMPTSIERLAPSTAVAMLARCTFVPDGSELTVARVRELAALAEAVPTYQMASGDLAEACAAVMRAMDEASDGVRDLTGSGGCR